MCPFSDPQPDLARLGLPDCAMLIARQAAVRPTHVIRLANGTLVQLYEGGRTIRLYPDGEMEVKPAQHDASTIFMDDYHALVN